MLLNWITSQAENMFDFSWLCGKAEDTIPGGGTWILPGETQTTTVKIPQKFAGSVWSDLEYEPSWEGDGSTLSTGDRSDSTARSGNDGTDGDDDDDDARSIRSCQEPQERNSNMPVLRHLPSFGSTLASNSIQGRSNPANSGLSSYPTRSRSMESATDRSPFFLKSALHSQEESHIQVKSNFVLGSATDSYIFLQQ